MLISGVRLQPALRPATTSSSTLDSILEGNDGRGIDRPAP
jgi:hypothetical protein